MKNIKRLFSCFLILTFIISSFCINAVFAGSKKLVFDASADYSGVQGQDNWYYKYRKIDDGVEGELLEHSVFHTNNRWYAQTSANRDLGMICGPDDTGSWTQDVMFTGMFVNKADGVISDTVLYTSAREFKAPYTGVITIGASNLKGQSANTKVYLRILYNGEKIWPSDKDWYYLTGNGAKEFSKITQGISKGDTLVFEIKRATVGEGENEIKSGVVANQGAAWTPVITYENSFDGAAVYDYNGEKYGWIDENNSWTASENGLASEIAAALTLGNNLSNAAVSVNIKPASLSAALKIYPYYNEESSYSVCVKNTDLEILKNDVSKATCDYAFNSDTSYTIKVSAYNADNIACIVVFVNGVEVLSYRDKEENIQSGKIAIETEGAVTIEDITIEAIENNADELILINDADLAINAAFSDTNADNVAAAFEKIKLVSNKVALAAFDARMASIMSSFAYIRGAADTATKILTIDGMAYNLKNLAATINITGPDGYSATESADVDENGNFKVEHTIPYELKSGEFTVAITSENLSANCDYVRALDACDITKFSLDSVNGTINGTDITVNLTETTDVSSMVAVFEASDKASVYVGETIQVSGTTENNFSDEVEYKVVAEDKTEKIYTVTVNPYVAPTYSGSSGSSGGGSGSSRRPGSIASDITVTSPVNPTPETEVSESTQQHFADVPKEHWAFDYVEKLYALGAVNGDENGNFNPNGKITRAEFVKLLVEVLNLSKTSDIAFSDVDENDWYYKYVNIAYTEGLVNGVSETEFSPASQITREDMALILSRAFPALTKGEELTFKDTDKISSYALDAVKALFANNIISGNNGFFNPKDSASRCEAAKMIVLCIK